MTPHLYGIPLDGHTMLIAFAVVLPICIASYWIRP